MPLQSFGPVVPRRPGGQVEKLHFMSPSQVSHINLRALPCLFVNSQLACFGFWLLALPFLQWHSVIPASGWVVVLLLRASCH